MWRRIAVCVGLAVVFGGCSSSPPAPSASSGPGSPTASASSVVASASPSVEATAQPTVQPTPTPAPPTATDATFSLLPADPPTRGQPQVSCQGDIEPTDQVAVVELRSDRVSGPVVLRDYRDPAKPTTVCALGKRSGWSYSIVDARHLLAQDFDCYRNQCVFAVIDVPEVRYHWFALSDTPDDYEDLMGVSPDLDAVAWRSSTYDDPLVGDPRSVYVTRAGGTRVVGHLPPSGGGFCGGPHFWSDYARSGAYFYLLDYESGNQAVFQVYHGVRRVFSLRTEGNGSPMSPSVPIWSPIDDALYYVRTGDIWRWTPEAGAKRFMPGVAWNGVTISPDGRYLAYSAPADGGSDNTYLVDLTAPSSEPEIIGRRREAPRFLTDTQLWLQPEPAGPGCVGPEPPPPVIYDIDEVSESPSIIRRVLSTWPAT